jgi:protein-L-isoaspartate(D-aspartate) O-methyltransferase
LADKVYSIERIRALAMRAIRRIESLGYYNVLIRVGDGSVGWKEMAPFDAILVTAGTPQVPIHLVEQLGEDGRLVVPVGHAENQVLRKGTKKGATSHWTELGNCVFVKLVGEQGWSD